MSSKYAIENEEGFFSVQLYTEIALGILYFIVAVIGSLYMYSNPVSEVYRYAILAPVAIHLASDSCIRVSLKQGYLRRKE